MSTTKSKNFAVKKTKGLISSLGPGFITGAADDDPSGVATYSIAGAQFGYGLAWLTLFTLPLMIAVQEACARIGITTGQGLAGIIRRHYSRTFLWAVVSLLAIANIINIGADLGAMADVVAMITNQPWWIWLVLITGVTVVLEVVVPYRKYEQFLKVFGLFLLAYILTAVIVSPQISTLLTAAFIPHMEFSFAFLTTAVGFLGTTISPYLFFWQASEEVEDEIAQRKIHGFGMGKPKFDQGDIKRMRLDTNLGMIFSQIVTFAIIVTTTETLHRSGATSILSAKDAALALRPLAGDFAYLLFALGLIGIGLQAIPVLAGSLAYAVTEVFHQPEGLGKSFSQARLFYLVIVVASVIGALLNVLGINPIQALFYAAIVNGLIAVPLIIAVAIISVDKSIMGRQTSGPISLFFTSLAALVMGAASIIMICLAVKGG